MPHNGHSGVWQSEEQFRQNAVELKERDAFELKWKAAEEEARNKDLWLGVALYAGVPVAFFLGVGATIAILKAVDISVGGE